MTSQVNILLLVTGIVKHTDEVQDVRSSRVNLIISRLVSVRSDNTLTIDFTSRQVATHVLNNTSLLIQLTDQLISSHVVILLSPDLVLLIVQIECVGQARDTFNFPSAIISSVDVNSVLTDLRQTELECNRTIEFTISRKVLIEVLSIVECRNNLLLEPVLTQILLEVASCQRLLTNLSGSRNVSINLDGVRSTILIAFLEVIPVVEYAVGDISSSEVNLINVENESYPDRGTVVLVNETNYSRESLLVQTLRLISCINEGAEASPLLVTSQVRSVLNTTEVPYQNVSVLIPVVSVGRVVMRSVPYTTEPVSIGSIVINILHALAYSVIIVTNPRSLSLTLRQTYEFVLTLVVLEVTTSPEVVLISRSIESTIQLTSSRIHVRHVVNVAVSYIEVVILLEVFLLHTSTVVQLSQDEVLHLRPCNLSRVAAVHVDLIQRNRNLEVISLVSNDTQLDVTITYNLTILGNEVNTYQRLTANNFCSSSLTLDSLAIFCYRTRSEDTISNLLDVS